MPTTRSPSRTRRSAPDRGPGRATRGRARAASCREAPTRTCRGRSRRRCRTRRRRSPRQARSLRERRLRDVLEPCGVGSSGSTVMAFMSANSPDIRGAPAHRDHAAGPARSRECALTAADGASIGASRSRVVPKPHQMRLPASPRGIRERSPRVPKDFPTDRVHRVRMTISQRPRGGWGSLVVLAGAGLLAIAFLGKAALPYLLQDPSAVARYASRRGWALTHVAAATVGLLTGPAQLWLGVSGRTPQGHRWLGRVYVASVGVGAAAAFYLSTHTDYGWVMGTGLTGLGLAWIVTTTLAVASNTARAGRPASRSDNPQLRRDVRVRRVPRAFPGAASRRWARCRSSWPRAAGSAGPCRSS